MLIPYVIPFCIGAIVGSFLNVVGLRFLREESIVLPPSHCYQCNEKIKPYDNIPILSWILLGGKCRHCKAAISIQYPLIELLTGLLFVVTVYQYGFTWQSAFLLFLIANFMVILITDFREQFIFDINSIGLIPFGLIYTYLNLGYVPGKAVVPLGFATITLPEVFISALFAVIGAFLIFFFLNLVSQLILGRPGFGEGDTRLLMGIGAFFGVKWMVLVFVLSFIIQAAVGIPILIRQWLLHKAYYITALLVVAFVFAVSPYFIERWVTQWLLLIILVLVSSVGALYCSIKAIKMAKELPFGLTVLPFGPAIVFACLLMLYFNGPIFSFFRLFLRI